MDPFSLTAGIAGIAGLAGLFSTCLDVIDKVDSYKDFGVESRSIIAQFQADKHLFQKWAQNVGIDNDRVKDEHHRDLDDPKTAKVVQRLLSSIQEIFSKTESSLSNLQPMAENDALPFRGRASYQEFQVSATKRNRIAWALRGKAKFVTQVQQFGALIQRLYSLVPPDSTRSAVDVHEDAAHGVLCSLNDDYADKAAWFSDSQRLLIEIEKHIENEIRKELDSWLDTSWTNGLYDKFVERRLSGTCEWILNRPAFLDWISPNFPSETAKVLWINGPAGYGKTILCARVVQYLSKTLESPLAYYFFSSDSGSRGDPFITMRSWISQVISCDRDAFKLAYRKWEIKEGNIASRTDIVELFTAIVHLIPNCTFIVDGLDECVWIEKNWKACNDDSPIGFLKSIKQAAAQTTTRIMIMSRDEPGIRCGFCTIPANDEQQTLYEYKISPNNVRSDAMSFSRSIINKKLANKTEILKDWLSRRMVNRCNAMFLWLKMQEEYLRSWKNQKQLEDTIDQTPTGLEHLYDRNWMRISHLPDSDRVRALSILQWAAFALRPLTILELTEALLVIDDNNRDDLLVDELPDTIDEEYVNSEILGLCGSLLEIQNAVPSLGLSSMVVRLTHFSVKQYILCNTSGTGLLMINEQLRSSNEATQNNILAKICLRYLNFREVWQEPLQLGSSAVHRPFRDYAASSWHKHAKMNGSNYEEVLALINILFHPTNTSWESWRRWFDSVDQKSINSRFPKEILSVSPLYYASRLGLRHTIVYLTDELRLNVNHIDGFSRTALQAACTTDNILVANMLLENGANLKIADNDGITPLHFASIYGRVEVVKLLLEKGADVMVTENIGCTPLHIASYKGYVEVVRMLLKNKANLNVANLNGWTLLHFASDLGRIEIIKILCQNGANIMAEDNSGWTPLHLASDRGQVEVVRALLEEGSDVTPTDEDGWTPLSLAADRGHVEVVKILLENGAEVGVQENNGCTPLNLASERGHVEVVKLLLEKGANVTVTNNNRWTPLNSASDSGHVEVVKLLLEKGANVTVTNNNGWTPLNSASERGHVEVVKLLLEKGPNMTVASNNGWTPLNLASDRGYVEVVKLLLEKGADMTAPDNAGWTAILVAAEKGHEPVINVLLDHGPIATSTLGNLNALLNALAYSGLLVLLRLIIEKYNVDCNQADTQGRTAAHFAARGGHIDVLEYLLTIGVNGDDVDIQGNGLLHYAASSASVDTVQKTIRFYKATPGSCNSWSPLHWACRNGDAAIISLLLENGLGESIVTTTEPRGRWTPHAIAVFHQNKNLICDSGENMSGVDLNRLGQINSSELQGVGIHESYLCDGCRLDIYGPRFHCLSCVDFDYCFMCKLTSELTHPNHKWEVVLLA